MSKKTAGYLIIGTIFGLVLLALLYLEILFHGVFWGTIWFLGLVIFSYIVNRLFTTAMEWIIEANCEERMAKEKELDAEFDKMFEELKTTGVGVIKYEKKDGKISMKAMSKAEFEKETSIGLDKKKITVKKPVAKKTITVSKAKVPAKVTSSIKLGNLHKSVKGRMVAR